MGFDEDLESGKSPFNEDRLDEVSVGHYMSKQAFFNNSDESVSLIEKTCKKLLPIYQEILSKIKTVEKKMANDTELEESSKTNDADESSDFDSKLDIKG